MFYAVMTSKPRLLYDALFLSIRNFFSSFKPTKCVVDFETALNSSINFNFESQMQRCLFHSRQALWRKWSRLGIGKDEEILKWLKKLMALPLLLENKIELCFHALAPTDEKPIAHLIQPCGHMICTNCVQKNNCQLCGCRISIFNDSFWRSWMIFSCLAVL